MGLFDKRPKTEPRSPYARPTSETDEVVVATPEVEVAEPEQPEVATPEQWKPLDRTEGRALMHHLQDVLRGVPNNAIIEEWSSRSCEGAWPKTCPSVVPEAFFTSPCSEAVPFFERYVFPVSKFEAEYDPDVMEFVSRCKNRALAIYVRDSIEQFGAEDTLARIASGFGEDSTLSTRIMELAGIED